MGIKKSPSGKVYGGGTSNTPKAKRKRTITPQGRVTSATVKPKVKAKPKVTSTVTSNVRNMVANRSARRSAGLLRKGM